MNPEMQKCRSHYESLPRNVRERTTAQMLLKAIQIAEQAEANLQAAMEVIKAFEVFGGGMSRITSSAQPASSSSESV